MVHCVANDLRPVRAPSPRPLRGESRGEGQHKTRGIGTAAATAIIGATPHPSPLPVRTGRGSRVGASPCVCFAAVLAVFTATLEVRAEIANLEPPQAQIEAAKTEGQISVYTSMNDTLTRAFLNAFEKRYGIKGSFFRAPTTPLLQRFAVEHDGNGVAADIFSVASPLPFAQHPDWFAPLDAATAPNLKNWPERGVHTVSVTWTNEILALAYNTDEVKAVDVPRTWADALNPKWKDRIVLSDPRAADNYMGWLDAIERAHGTDFLKTLSALNFKLTPSGASGVQLVAAGAVAMNFPTINSFTVPLIEKKAPIAVVFPEGPQLASARDVAVVVKAPHPQAARLFFNWILSLEATRLYCSLSSVAIVGDPEGKAGCLPSHHAQGVNFDVNEQRARALTRDLGLNQ